MRPRILGFLAALATACGNTDDGAEVADTMIDATGEDSPGADAANDAAHVDSTDVADSSTVPACTARASCGTCITGQSCGGAGVADTCGARTCNHYVASTASTRPWSECTTETQTCSLATANANARAGDVICLAGGSYATGIAPVASGTSSAPITYVATAGVAKITGVSTGISLSNVSFVEVDGVTVDDVVRFFEMRSAKDCWIRNTTFRDASAYSGATIDRSSVGARITGCTFVDAPHAPVTATLDEESRPADYVTSEGDRVLFAGNKFGTTSHYALMIFTRAGGRTVIRDNIIHNRYHGGIGAYTYAGESGRVLIEHNDIYDVGVDYRDNPNLYSRTRTDYRDDGDVRGRQLAIQIVCDGLLLRRNRLRNCGRGLFINGYVSSLGDNWARNARIAHNTLHGSFTNLMFTNSSIDNKLANIVLKNNLFAAGSLREVHGDQIAGTEAQLVANGFPVGAGFRYVYHASTNRTNRPLDAIEASYSTWRGNLSLDAGFVSAPSDLRLSASSAAADRGAPLTTITTAASPSATSITVADASWFYDGWGVAGERGDLVMTSGGAVARVLAVDVAGKKLTLETPIAFTDGEGIGYAYAGAAPDLGAYERCAP